MPRRGKTKRIHAWDAAGQGCSKVRAIAANTAQAALKSEARNPRRTSAADRASRQRGQSFGTSDFGLPSDFGFRPSDLGWQRPTLEHPWYWGDDRTDHRHPISRGGAKPPKAPPRAPQSHILGIDSGVQRHPKATSRPPQGLLIANRLGPQSHPKAIPKPPQSHPKAIPRLPQGYPK